VSTTVPAAGRLPRRGEAYLPADTSVPLVEHTVGHLVAARAAEHPEREALVGVRHGSGEVDRLTYAALCTEAQEVAARLAAVTDPGDYVALWAPNVIEWTVVQYAAALAGVVLVALNPVLRENDLDYVLRHSRARVLLHARASRQYDMAEVAERVCAGIPHLRRVCLSELMALEPTDQWSTRAAAVCVDHPVMLQYTSGTTGRPKGVLLTHRALVNVAKLTMEATAVPDAVISYNPLPLFHTAGCVIGTLGPLWVGGTTVVGERFTPDMALETLRREKVTMMFYVPAVLRALLHAQAASSEAAPDLRIILGGASDVPADLIAGAAAVFGAQVYNAYGQTELSPVLTITRPSDTAEDRLTTVGRPLPRVDCKIIDPESGATVALGEIGEICARGYQQFLEYVHDPHATARALDADGFVRTGDLGFMDDRGYLSVTGRLKELIIRGGENISPVEVESVIARHEAVLDVVALGIPDAALGEVVAVVCRLSGGRGDVLAGLIAHARDRMPAYRVPARWFTVDEFPVTPTGKVQRFALREAALAGQLREL
jgi:fatty-acyl-CoA synthase/long-chain acyl-CoA synthetase